jgi:hypothetical protein
MSIDGRWGWVPGPMQVAPVYAPALVVFVGRGPGFGGNIGWFPLGSGSVRALLRCEPRICQHHDGHECP